MQCYKKNVCLLIIIMAFMLALTGCTAASDWEHELPNDYVVVKVNSNAVVLEKKNDANDTYDVILDRYITEFCYNDSYIGLKRIPMDNVPGNEEFDIEQFNDSQVKYYLVDTMDNRKYFGPYSFDEYAMKCQDLNVADMCEWIKTY